MSPPADFFPRCREGRAVGFLSTNQATRNGGAGSLVG